MKIRPWTEFFAAFGSPWPVQQGHMLLGLVYIRRLARAKTLQIRRIAIASEEISNDFFFADGLQSTDLVDGVPLGDPEEEKYIPEPWYPDPDSGPENIWRWAHHSQQGW